MKKFNEEELKELKFSDEENQRMMDNYVKMMDEYVKTLNIYLKIKKEE